MPREGEDQEQSEETEALADKLERAKTAEAARESSEKAAKDVGKHGNDIAEAARKRDARGSRDEAEGTSGEKPGFRGKAASFKRAAGWAVASEGAGELAERVLKPDHAAVVKAARFGTALAGGAWENRDEVKAKVTEAVDAGRQKAKEGAEAIERKMTQAKDAGEEKMKEVPEAVKTAAKDKLQTARSDQGFPLHIEQIHNAGYEADTRQHRV